MSIEYRKASVVRCAAVAFVLGQVALAGSAAELASIAPAAVAAVEQLFPEGSIVGFGRETESGVSYFEVAVKDGDRRVEIEVTPDGGVGEVETVVAVADLPRAVSAGIARLAGGAAISNAERHEIRGVPRDGAFAPVEPPVVVYEASYEADGVRREIAVGEDGQLLPNEDEDDNDTEDDGDDAD